MTSRTCEWCDSRVFHGPHEYVHQDGSSWLYVSCAQCGHIVLLCREGE
jgi:RNase P subunit RPR2